MSERTPFVAPLFVAPATSPVGRNRVERKHLERLERRADHLAERAYGPDGDRLSYDRSEIAAIRWALSRIAELERLEADDHA